MIARIIIASALMFAASGAASAQEADGRVTEFRDICVGERTFEAYNQAALTRGWTEVAPTQSRLARLIELGERSMPGAAFKTFTRDVDGASLDLLISNIAVDQVRIHGCGLYEFGQEQAVSADAFSAWIGAAPQTDTEMGATIHSWQQPRAFPGVYVVKLGHIPPRSTPGQMGLFNGVSMTVDRIER